MSAFRPTRSSPPAKRPIDLSQSISAASLATSQSSAPVPELTNLTAQDVELIDVIIARAGDAATTFLTVFKAYNDILQERGLDPHEVVYYGKLLKLGTLKGRNWADKWAMVKKQYGYNAAGAGPPPPPVRQTQTQPARPTQPSRQPARALRQVKPIIRDDDTFTLHSHENESVTDAGYSEEPTPRAEVVHPALARARARQRPPPPAPSDVTSNSLGLDFGDSASQAPVRRRYRGRVVSESSEETADNFAPPSTTPPSYRAAARDILLGRQPLESKPRQNVLPSVLTQVHKTAVPTQKVSTINDEDAWKNIRMAQNEKDADEYYRLRLLERCLDVWKQGLDWIITTHEQIQEARENLLARLYLQRWRQRLANRRHQLQMVALAADQRCLKSVFMVWRRRLIAKQNANWRDAMRGKMKIVRHKREGRLRKDAWAKWRQSYKSHLSDQHYNERLVLRIYKHWKERLIDVDHLEDMADQYLEGDLARVAEGCWNQWRRMAQLRLAERAVAERVNTRLKSQLLNQWQRQMHDLYAGDEYFNLFLLKDTLRKWKNALTGVRQLVKRADRHIARQDDVLMRAIIRVWKARERGRLLARVKAMRLMKSAWSVWLARIDEERRREALAKRFASKSSHVLVFSFQTWRSTLSSHKKAHERAIQHHASHVQHNAWFAWRIQLQETAKMNKKARLTEVYFLLRRTWHKMGMVHEQRVLEKKLAGFSARKMGKVFQAWKQRAQRRRDLRLAEEHISDLVKQRVLRSTLTHWTNRVIDIKLREIEVKQRYEVGLLITSFTKWKHICIRHVEDLSLMESYREVRREDYVRRVFHQWLAAARASRHRNLLLKRLEDEKQLTLTVDAWEKWREKFKEEQLRPLEYQFIFQVHNDTLRSAMARWKARTKSVPAIRFHGKQVRAKYWAIWRAQMPRIQLAKKAKEVDRKNTLSHFLDEWVQAYRTKLTRKAVDRARLLRLPTATSTPRLLPTTSRPDTGISGYRNIFPPRRPLVREPKPEEREPSPPRPFATRRTIFPAITRPRSGTSPTRSTTRVSPSTREPSPARSTKSAFATRGFPPPPPSTAGGSEEPSRLWKELRQVRSRSKPSSERSRGRYSP